jgi:hypothetical protein
MNLQTIKTSILRSLKVLTITFACTLILLSNAFPAMAIEANRSKPTDKTAQLNTIERKSQKAVDPQRGVLTGEKATAESNAGLNEVQGAADADKMSTPGNSQDAVTVGDEIKNALEKVTGKG